MTIASGKEHQDPDTIVLRSAGIDIGSATTHLVTSRITMKRLGRSHSSRYVIVNREIDYMSPVVLTPYVNREMIDTEKLIAQLSEWVGSDEYSEDTIDTGVVMLTGEAARRRNTRQITDVVSRLAGDFVCAAAGDLFEVDMAAHGSGAVGLSEDGATILNIDIGGGTTKVSVCAAGQIIIRGVFWVGARDIVVDDARTITRLEVPGEIAAKALGLSLAVDSTVSDSERETVASWLVSRFDEFLRGGEGHEAVANLTIVPMSGPLPDTIDKVVFSSGVGEYIYDREDRTFGDLAPCIAQSVTNLTQSGRWPWEWHVPEASPIRATVTGIAEQTVEMSGDTIYVGSEDILPLRNREVRRLDIAGLTDAVEIARAMKEAGAAMSLSSTDGKIVWDVHCSSEREFSYLAQLAEGLGEGGKSVDSGSLGLVLDQDIAMLIGRLIAEELDITHDVVVLDGIELDGVHFVDFGRFRPDSNTVPVVLKSLVFVDRSRD